MVRKKLLHIMMGQHNPDLKNGLSYVFDCIHIDWIPYRGNTEKLQKDVLKTVADFKPDVVFMHLQREGVITVDTAKAMREAGAVVFSWTGDVRYPVPEHYLTFGKHIDATLFSNMTDVEFCNTSGGITADFLQVGYDSNNFSPFGDTDTKYPEIIFMGSNYPNHTFPLSQFRHNMVVRLKQEFGNRFGLYGGGWGNMADGNITSYKEEGIAYRSCKVAINLSHFAYKRYSSDRLFRILGSGAFCLSHHYPDMDTDFNVGNDLVVWNDIDDLIAKIKDYLPNDAERIRIAYNGFNNASNNFTWHSFAGNLFALYEKYSSKKDHWVYQIKDAPKIKKYSQTGEEGYLKFILDNIGYGNRHLADVGSWDGFHLSNTRYFIEEHGYTHLLIDGDNRGNEEVKQEWITKDNICDIMRKYNCPKHFSLLSYDTDGNDFDILLALCTEYKPDVIICEVNGTIPLGVSKKIKYNPDHTWGNDDYYGFSFSAGLKLAELIGYRVVFQNDALNIYMVRKSLLDNPYMDIPIPFKHNQYHKHNNTGEWEEVK